MCSFRCVAIELSLVEFAQHPLRVISGLELAVEKRGSAEVASVILVQQQLHKEARIAIVAWLHVNFEQLARGHLRKGMNGETRLQLVEDPSLHRDNCEGWCEHTKGQFEHAILCAR